MEFFEELKELNLDENEIKVYLACLNLGNSKVNDIARKSGLIRTTVYGILKSLMYKGIISSVVKKKINYYTAASPDQLIEMLEEKKKRISSILPKLKEIESLVPHKHSVGLFEGKEGFKTIVNELVSVRNSNYYIVGPFLAWIDFSQFYTTQFYRRKKEMNVKAQVITDFSERKNIKEKKAINSEFRFLENFDTLAEFILWENKVMIVSFERDNMKGIVIEDVEIAKLYSIIFQNLWKVAIR
jgi:HTH-type transcriptional regulator, sugar sensing transcriptional regulator